MPIPDFQDLQIPLLKLISDRKAHKMTDINTALSEQFKQKSCLLIANSYPTM